MKGLTILFLFLVSLQLLGQRQIDVQHYQYEIELSDGSDVINGKARITTKFLEASSAIEFNLNSVEDDKGMQVFVVKESGKSLKFLHRDNLLKIVLNDVAVLGEVKTFEIHYVGKPKDGLIISKNKYGERTFFADNWPDRAQQWIPCNDTPADKASVEFIVKAPSHYKIISNGALLSEKYLTTNIKRTHWKEEKAIPTKVMVIGAADFAVKRVDSSYKIPVTAWVYKKDSAKGVYDYGLGDDILKFFENYIGKYPFKKLANVQSKTIFGGMENAGAIFYGENTLKGDRSSEALMAHEIAHQWFGNTATEKSYAHLWLSEGFATYLTHLYIEHKYGVDSFQKRIKEDRNIIIAFSKKNNRPVVDSVSGYMDLLNANSYQKGGWVLHMLRQEVGDSLFKNLIRTYYEQYKFSNADTRDFQQVAEKVSGRNLSWFFDQWLYGTGIPKLELKWKKDDEGIKIEIEQKGKNTFKGTLYFEIVTESGKRILSIYTIKEKELKIKLPITEKVMKVIFDPFEQFLSEGSVIEK
jgi:aminopeptidase N